MTSSNDENFPHETYNKKRRENVIYPTCIRNEKHFKGQLNVLVSFNKRDKPWQWMPLKSLRYGQKLLHNFRTYKARLKRKQENSNLKSDELNSIDKTMAWEDEIRFDQDVIQSSIGIEGDEDRVNDIDTSFYPNNNDPKVDGMMKDSWSESIEVDDTENEGIEKSMTNVAYNDRFIVDVMVPLYQKILKIVENGSNDADSVCSNGKVDFYQDYQKINDDYNKPTYYFEHAETDGAHNLNNQLQIHSPDSQNNRSSWDQESSIPIFNDKNNFQTYRHYNETNYKSHLTEDYSEPQQQNYITTWCTKNSNRKLTTYADIIEEKSWNEECSNGMIVSSNNNDDSSTTRVKESTDVFGSIGDSILKLNSWAPWKDKDDFDNELDKLLKNFKTEVTDRLTMNSVIS
ncbi:1526_t:CDS:2 [Dentiscutata erythropus]|uniref:1526_t:CDS:1 n=1 Tax=Dentiscutata erythropus TaxID=1348616 RepID=A0A9N9C151_9GLOM|nr:1526_t:CDS:2 [Dentiscutata erythropus]